MKEQKEKKKVLEPVEKETAEAENCELDEKEMEAASGGGPLFRVKPLV